MEQYCIISVTYICLHVYYRYRNGYLRRFWPFISELFPTRIRSTAMGSSFNLARGSQFLTPILIALIGAQYGLGSGIFLGSIFALSVAIFIWTFPETKAIELQKLE
ncbi:MAG: MFS transporter [Methanobacterium sp.]